MTPIDQQQEKPKQHARLAEFGGLNLDASESSIPAGDFTELLNWRKTRPKEAEVRTGIREWRMDGPPVGPVVATSEYRLDDKVANVIFIVFEGDLFAVVVNNEISPQVQLDVGPIVTGTPGDTYEVDATQFNTFLVVTVFGHGVYALYPSAADLTAWNAPIQLGKTLTPLPDDFTFKDQVSGDLIIYESVDGNPHGNSDLKYIFGSGREEPVKIRLPIGATYWRVSASTTEATNIRTTDLVQQWAYGKGNGDPHLWPPGSFRKRASSDHLHKRGWYYRLIARSEYTDAKGQKFSFYHEPSVDFYVPDNIVTPAFLANDDSGQWKFVQKMEDVATPKWDFTFDDGYPGTLKCIPSLGVPIVPPVDALLAELQKKFRAYFKDEDDLGGVGTNNPYFFTARMLGWMIEGDTHYNAGMPYKVAVPMSELLGAPHTVFDWADFTGLPANTVEIEVYRTAHEDSETAMSDGSPLFRPHRYGYAGTIKVGGTFTDTTKDEDLQFNGVIDDNSGFMAGQCSGKAIRVWSKELRLGDVQTSHELHKPTKFAQGFAIDWVIDGTGLGTGFGLIPKADLIGDAGDGLPEVSFAYQYVDQDGKVSEATVITVTIDPLLPQDVGVAFTFPRGYSPTINTIYLLEGHFGAGPRVYKRIATITTEDGYYIYKGGDYGTGVAAEPKTVETSHDPGAAIWTSEGEMNFWPQENFEIEHQFAPITAIGSVSGPAYIATDQSINMTDFGIDNRWEEIDDKVGCVGRRAYWKTAKVMIFLSPKGLFLAEGNGIRPFPAHIQSAMLEYLQEEIPFQPRCLNAKRASMGWLGQRNELWVSFPASTDIPALDADGDPVPGEFGKLPARTFIYRLLGDYGEFGLNDVQNYQFQMTPADPQQYILFIESPSTSRLFATYFDEATTELVLIDCDATTEWTGAASATIPLTLGATDTIKRLYDVRLTVDFDAALTIQTGQKRTDGVRNDIVNGEMNPGCAYHSITADPGFVKQLRHDITGRPPVETTAYVPMVRLISTPSPSSGKNKCKLKSLDVEYDIQPAE